jgi:hypothetical protein
MITIIAIAINICKRLFKFYLNFLLLLVPNA